MLDNFRKIYDQELDKLCSEGAFEHLILSSTKVRVFVYEVCKGCVASQLAIEANAQKPCRFCQSWIDYGGNFCLNCGRDLRTA